MTTTRRIRQLGNVARLICVCLLILVLGAWQGTPDVAGVVPIIQGLVPWAVGIIGTLCLYLLRLARDLEKDFTAVKSSHEARLLGHDREIAELKERTGCLAEEAAGVEARLTASRHKTNNDLMTPLGRLDERLVYLERKVMEGAKR